MTDDFAAGARSALAAAGVSMRRAARILKYDPGYVSRVLNGKQRPSLQLASGLDRLVGAGGELYALVAVAHSDDRARVARSAARPSLVDTGTVSALADVLVAQRRLDDTLGSAAMLPAALAHLSTVTTLAREARGPHRSDMVDVAAQWAVFGGWLTSAVGRHADAAAWFDRAAEWSAEADNPTLSATTWSFKAYLAGHRGNDAATVGLATVARRMQGVHPSQHTYSTLQAARGHALLGERDEARRILEQAEALLDAATAAGAPPEATYWNRRPFFQLHIGRTCLVLGDAADAVMFLRAGLDSLPREQREAEWCTKYADLLDQAVESA